MKKAKSKPKAPALPDRKIASKPAGSLGVREYARARTAAGHSISHVAVLKAIKTGRIVEAVWRDEQGKAWIDPAQADRLLDQNTDPAKKRDTKSGGRPAQEKTAGLFGDNGPEPETVRPAIASERDQSSATFSKSRAVRETYDAQLSRLKFQKESGLLVSAELARSRAESAGVLVREALLALPPRLAGKLAAENEPIRIEELLADEISRALHGLAELARPLA